MQLQEGCGKDRNEGREEGGGKRLKEKKNKKKEGKTKGGERTGRKRRN